MAAQNAIDAVKKLRNENPVPVPTELLGATSRWICIPIRSKQSLITLLPLALAVAWCAPAQAEPDNSGVVIEVNGAKRGLYPIATPAAAEGDAVSKEVAQVESFNLSVAGVFKVLNPQSFLADLKAGAARHRAAEVEGRRRVRRGQVPGHRRQHRVPAASRSPRATRPRLTKTYKRAGNVDAPASCTAGATRS